MKQHVVIVGAGLGGCYLAAGLVKYFDVTMVELSDEPPLLRDRVMDVARPAVTYPNIESGFGGTTKAWHNALMEIDATVFDKKWPFSKDTIAPYYEQAYSALSGTTREHVFKFADALRDNLINMGVPESLLAQSMFIPKVRVNAWDTLALKGKVKAIEGEVTDLIPDGVGGVGKVKIRRRDGEHVFVEADYFVLAAGGLSSPLLLQKLTKSWPLEGLKHAGVHYEDHPIAFVGEVELDKPLYKLWDYPVKTATGNANIRLPLSLYWKGLNISFQLRPAHHLRLSKPRTKIISALTDLRNFPFKPINYWRLLTHVDDIFDILSFKFGLRIPTRNYSILMVAEQPSASYCSVWKEDNNTDIRRRWEADDSYIKDLNEALDLFLKTIRPIIKQSRLFPEWPAQIYSSSHHSGTARLSKSPENGVCDLNGQVHGLSNLFVCDGSLIPASGFVNTGLTIVALAMRMSDFLSNLVSNKPNAK
ncbi:MAG: GMC oxidoreductase [Burkholderiaceae bacterium]|nr:GMC oxidoreductase [Burkholderiaceae bacterium]